MKAVEEELKKISDASADLCFAVEAAGGCPWEGWPGLTGEETKRQLEEQQDVVDDLLERGEVRQHELIRLGDFYEEQSQEGELHNDGFNVQGDDRLRRRKAELYGQTQARLRELQGRTFRGSQAEDGGRERRG